MQPLNAVVKNGRLTLDVPSDLAEGQVVVLLPLDELLAEALDDDHAGAGSGAGDFTFQIIPPSSPSPRSWRKKKVVDAAALIEELRSI